MAELKNLIVEGDTRLIGDTNAGKVTATSFVKSGGTSSQFLKADGSVDSNTYATQTWVNNKGYSTTDTKNTAGSTNSTSKLFLIGATAQAASAQTYSRSTAYVGTDGCLYSNGTKTLVSGDTPYIKGAGTGSAVLAGGGNTASGNYSHAEGSGTTASGAYSHAEGSGTTAQNQSEHAQGQYNVSHKQSASYGNNFNTIHSIGVGKLLSRQNAFEVTQNGYVFVDKVGGYDGYSTSLPMADSSLQRQIPKTAYIAVEVGGEYSGPFSDYYIDCNQLRLSRISSWDEYENYNVFTDKRIVIRYQSSEEEPMGYFQEVYTFTSVDTIDNIDNSNVIFSCVSPYSTNGILIKFLQLKYDYSVTGCFQVVKWWGVRITGQIGYGPYNFSMPCECESPECCECEEECCEECCE